MLDPKRKDLRWLPAALVAFALCGVVWGQDKVLPGSANPGFANPDTPGLMAGKPAPDVMNTVDIVFLKQLSLGGRAEVELGKLASTRGESAGVSQFGERMIKDHGAANDKLASLARSGKVELPGELDAAHVAARAELQRLSGKTFDIRYAEVQMKEHQTAVELLIHVVGSGQHAGVRQFAADTLPAVMKHLEMAKTLHAQLTGAGPPVVAMKPH